MEMCLETCLETIIDKTRVLKKHCMKENDKAGYQMSQEIEDELITMAIKNNAPRNEQ